MNYKGLTVFLFLSLFLFGSGIMAKAEDARESPFPTLKEKEEFVNEVSVLIEKAWGVWQDAVEINDIEVEGARGMLFSGSINRPVLTSSSMTDLFDRQGKSLDYISCVKVVTDTVEEAVRSWQRSFSHTNIPFPQAASCTFTLSPCGNVPATLAGGEFSSDKGMTKSAIYRYMLYRAPEQNEDIFTVFRAFAKAFEECFNEWKETCFIVGIKASGGIAPNPAPIGPGPGPVRNAKGNNGKLRGPYFNGQRMREKSMNYIKDQIDYVVSDTRAKI